MSSVISAQNGSFRSVHVGTAADGLQALVNTAFQGAVHPAVLARLCEREPIRVDADDEEYADMPGLIDDDDEACSLIDNAGGGGSAGMQSDAGHSTSAGHADVLRDCLCQTLRSAGAIDEDDETVLVDGRFPMYYTGQKHVAGTVKASDLKARTGFNWTVYELKLPSTFPEITPGNSDGFEATLNNTKINSCPNKVNQNNPAVNTMKSKSANKIKKLGLYVALSDDLFESPADFWLKSKMAKSHRVLLALGLEPDISEACRAKVTGIVTALAAVRDELNNTISFDAVLVLKPEHSKQKQCSAVLSTSLAHMFKNVQNKELCANVAAILRGVGIERKDITRGGKRAGETYLSVNGCRSMNPVAAWNYGVKLYHALIAEDILPESSAAKRKADDDDEPVVVSPPAKKEKATLHAFFGKGKKPFVNV